MRTIWILFLALILPVWKLWRLVPLLTEVAVYFGSWCLVLLASYWLARFLSSKLPMKMIDGKGKAVLVTGCDTGFGNRLAKRLSREGFFVYAGCLNAASNEARQLSKEPNVHVLQLDVTKEEQMDEALVSVKNTLGSRVLWAVVANAGIPSMGLVEWHSMALIRHVFDVNVFGVVSVSRKFLPLLRKSKGRLVLVASVLGRGTIPFGVPYCMSKHAVISLADGLRTECRDKGVHVATIEPTAYRTPIMKDVGRMEVLREQMSHLPPDVLEEYSESEVEEWMKTGKALSDLTARDNINEVVDQMTLAVRESQPKPNYSAWGPLDPPLYFFFRVAPAELMDAGYLALRKIAKRVWKK
ncbi:retinol dehydrogenase 7-like [Amblyomma americanum]